MTDEPTVPLQVYLESRINSAEKQAELALQASTRASEAAERVFEKRMDGMNEWRKTVEDLAGRQASQEAVDALSKRVQRLDDLDATSRGKHAGLSQLGTIAAASIATAATMIGIYATINGS